MTLDAPRIVRRWLGVAGALSLSACALLPPNPPEPVQTPLSAAPALGHLNYRLEVDAPGDLRTLLMTHLDLARFQTTGTAEDITGDELVRLANATPAQARTLLETEGYFSAEVVVRRSDAPEAYPVFEVTVTPGRRTHVKALQLRVEGALQTQADAGDAAAQKLLSQLTSKWLLPPGEPFRQSDWSSAKNAALAQLQAEGYPSASWGPTEARVDAWTQSVSLSGLLHSGPQFVLGEMRIEGLSRYDEAAMRNLAEFQAGTPYNAKRMLDYQDRLGKLGLFESVLVEIDPDPQKAHATPVIVKVRERHRQQAIIGLGYSDQSGVRTTLEHRHRRPFGWDGQLSNKLELGTNSRSWEGELISDPTSSRYRNLLGTSLTHLRAADETTDSSRVRLGRSLDSERIDRLIFGEALSGKLRNSSVDEHALALSLNYNWVWRELDSVILPTRGLNSSIEFGLGRASSNFGSSGAYARVHARNTLYWPVGKGWHTQLRLEAGQVFAPRDVGMPDALMFRAGGDESVRGYAYRTLGPKKFGSVASGRTLLTSSAELARPFTSRLPTLWWATFIDAGNADNSIRDLTPALGYGLGLRYRSPAGPIRVDLAYGEKVRKTRVHLSVGIAF